MHLSRFLSAIASMLIACGGAQAITRYATIHNRFGSLMPPAALHCQACIEGDRYVVDNGSSTMQPVADTTVLPADRFRVQARMANQHNNPRSSYTVCTPGGGKQRIHSTEWGLYVATADERWELAASCSNTNPNDELTDQRSMTVDLRHVTALDTTSLASRRLTKGVNLYNRLNTFQLELRDGALTAWAGDDQLEQLFTVPLAIGAARVQTGCLAGAGSKLEIERCVVSYDEQAAISATQQWTTERLDGHFALSDDPVEGYWQYQDRDIDDRHLRLGGRYLLAVVREADAYEIIYIDGAQTRRSQWHTGMLKGRFSRTIFSDHYDLTWIDATGEPIAQDAYVTVENGVLLTLKFPVFNSQMRLSKVLH